MNKYLLFFLFCISFSVPAFAAKISGVVTDASTGEPLQGVLVVIKELNKPVETDDSGRYELNNVPGGTYEVLFNFLTYKQVLQTVSIINNKDVVLNIKLKPENNTLKDVTVKAVKTTNTENAVLMEIKKSSLVVSGISAAQIQKTADRNAADVVKRIPGVTILDNRFIMVRGLYDRYNSVWLNDAGAPSGEVDKKSFSFDIIPSGVLDRIMVYKTPSPELPGDFAGGMVKIYTSSLPDKNNVTVGFQTSYRQNSTGKTYNYNQPSSTDWLGYDDGKRSIPSIAPAKISRTDSNNSEVAKAFGKNDWLIKNQQARPDYRFNLSAGNVVNIGKVKLGNVFALSYSNLITNFSLHRQSHDSVDQEFDYNDYQSANLVNASLMDNLVAVFGNSKIEFKNLYNQSGKSAVTLRTTAGDSTSLYTDEKSYAIGYESRAVYASQLIGSHKTKGGKTSYNWALGYTDLFRNQPDLRRIRYSKQQIDDDTMYQAGIQPGVDPVNGGGRFFSELYENVYSFNHQLTQKITLPWWNYSFDVSAGNFIEYKSRYYSARSIGFIHKPDSKNPQPRLLKLPLEEIFADSNLGDRSRFRIDEITAPSDKYNAKNTLIASFVSTKFTLANKITISGGVRYEDNRQELKGFRNLDSIEPKITTRFALPSVNVSYDFTQNMLIRAAYGKTLNRPEFREWAPIFFYDFDSKAGTYGSLYETLLTDTLDVAQIQNVDVRCEWYPATGEMVHAGVFYKSFKDPIQLVVLQPGIDTRSMTFMNAASAVSMGVEIDVRKTLAFADDWFKTDIFKDFAVVGNAAFIKSEMKFDDTISQQLSSVALQGQSPYMYNVGLFYQGEKTGLNGSLLYNVFGPRLIALGTQSIENVGEMPFQSLDLVLTKKFFKHYYLVFGVQNMLDSKSLTVQDIDRNGKFETHNTLDKEFTSFRPGRYYTIGVNVKF